MWVIVEPYYHPMKEGISFRSPKIINQWRKKKKFALKKMEERFISIPIFILRHKVVGPIKSSIITEEMLKNIVIPYRVHPGRLSVSRTIGDIDAKMSKYGGNPNVIISTPEIFSFELNSAHDFIFLGCIINNIIGDGIYDSMTNDNIGKSILTTLKTGNDSIHKLSGKAVEEVIRLSMLNKTLDNVTGVLIVFKNIPLFLEKSGKYKNTNKSNRKNIYRLQKDNATFGYRKTIHNWDAEK